MGDGNRGVWSLVLFGEILRFLHYQECPECGCVGRRGHDGDCTRDGFNPGRGLLGDAPAFFGTSLPGFMQLCLALEEGRLGR